MVSVIHRWIYGHILADLNLADIRTNLDDGAGHFVAHDHRQFGTSVRVALAWLRRKDWSSKILVDICATNATVCNFDSYIIVTTRPSPRSVTTV
jgi:hypothetical protein